jgi:hypothetical protein
MLPVVALYPPMRYIYCNCLLKQERASVVCQASVFILKADQSRELVGRRVASLYQDGNEVIFTDVRGQQTRMPGMILGVDLLRAVVFIGSPALVNANVTDASRDDRAETELLEDHS